MAFFRGCPYINQSFARLTVELGWSGLFGFSDDVSTLLTLLTVKEQGVPQGAVTSSYLANFAFWAHEPNMVRRLKNRGLTYTRFVDDISVSSKSLIPPKKKAYVISEIYGMLSRHGLLPKAGKHKISTSKQRMTTTKLVINARISLPRERRRNLRAAVYKLEERVAFGQHDEDLLKAINSTAVKVGQLKGYHIEEGNKLKGRLRIMRNRVVSHIDAANVAKLQIVSMVLGAEPASTLPPWSE